MADLKRTGLGLRAERAVLVQVASNRDIYEADLTFEELESLARTAGAAVVSRLRQHRPRPEPRYYVGKGKLCELRNLCAAHEPDVVICDDELSPAQVRALESALDVKVVDRTEVILDIFAAHARTRQAKLQVELAQLEYEFPRLKRMWTHLDRTAGGTLGGPAGGGIGVRGPGEKQLEVDRRLVQRRIHDLKRELEAVQRRRHTAAQGRHERFSTAALVGYTNAGKSSLLNGLTGAGVSVRDRLFETLDTRTRRWELPDGREVLLSDTVGFVRKFPHHLAASFHATLEEAREADLLLHVLDASRHESEQEIRAVNSVLEEIDCLEKPTLYLLNKWDLVEDTSDVALVRKLGGEVICTSTATGEG
ncbi:MAG: GTPase HflX, partial [Planctomycetota bacterium]